jgi:aryl-alcohol dehydrogenase-like predicted oxidoreductase
VNTRAFPRTDLVKSPTSRLLDRHGWVGIAKRWAERKNATLAQIALAWLLAQKRWIVPIPGTTQMVHMLENNGAAEVRFTPAEVAEVAELNSDVAGIEIRGARLPDQVLVLSGVEAPPKK